MAAPKLQHMNFRTGSEPASTHRALPGCIDHVGIRVSDRARALRFYQHLGFEGVRDLPDHEAAELENALGTRLNLIFNAEPSRANVLLDGPRKWPGLTHVAFEVPSLDALIAHLARIHHFPTEGPVRIGSRRVAVFFRDPDGNVLEFNELLASVAEPQT